MSWLALSLRLNVEYVALSEVQVALDGLRLISEEVHFSQHKTEARPKTFRLPGMSHQG